MQYITFPSLNIYISSTKLYDNPVNLQNHFANNKQIQLRDTAFKII